MKLSRQEEKGLASELDRLGFKIIGAAKRKCPVDTGRLRASLDHKVEDLMLILGSPVEYAPYQEYGTDKMPAQPYLRPAIDQVLYTKLTGESRKFSR